MLKRRKYTVEELATELNLWSSFPVDLSKVIKAFGIRQHVEFRPIGAETRAWVEDNIPHIQVSAWYASKDVPLRTAMGVRLLMEIFQYGEVDSLGLEIEVLDKSIFEGFSYSQIMAKNALNFGVHLLMPPKILTKFKEDNPSDSFEDFASKVYKHFQVDLHRLKEIGYI